MSRSKTIRIFRRFGNFMPFVLCIKHQLDHSTLSIRRTRKPKQEQMFRVIPIKASKYLIRFGVCSRQSSHAATTHATDSHATHGHGHDDHHFDQSEAYPAIGKREIVGFGINGNPSYFDMPDFPCPAVRWQVDTPEVLALKKKEQGDWKNMSIEEKKACMS